jgi:hypothetical protein
MELLGLIRNRDISCRRASLLVKVELSDKPPPRFTLSHVIDIIFIILFRSVRIRSSSSYEIATNDCGLLAVRRKQKALRTKLERYATLLDGQ